MKFLRSLSAPNITTVLVGQQYLCRVLIADSFCARMRGWYGYQDRSSERNNIDAVLLTNTRSVHTAGMTLSLDLLWLAPDLRCIELSRDVRPWRVRWCFHASHVLELARHSDNRLLLEEVSPGQHVQLVGETMSNPGKEACDGKY